MSKLKNRTKLGDAVDNKLYEQLNIIKEKTRINRSKLLDEAIEDLIKKYKHCFEEDKEK